ncbi:FkbM family methyltransferase [Spiribacter insolitus]|uniref:FkbM family methyltransferase n=1 Tax=Spiribacter insolitus TaxID=3122417 RepID=A0ABV3T8M5_9GAMM
MNARQLMGLARSLLIYGAPWRQPGLRRFYRPFVRPGAPVFDIGAHLGDRSLAFAALGGQVVAVEPQPGLRRALAWRLRRYADARVLDEAVGESRGTATLAMSDRHPTLATLNHQWRREIGRANPGFADVQWEREVTVEVVTLEDLIGRFGVPAFCKIDVEGAEEAVLAGLAQPLPALSFEYVSGSGARALACIDRLQALGDYRFNATIGERRRMVSAAWQSPAWMRDWLRANADTAGSGDVYARQLNGDSG